MDWAEQKALEIVASAQCGDDAAIKTAIANALRAERTACLGIAAGYGGRDAQEIADLIGARSFQQ